MDTQPWLCQNKLVGGRAQLNDHVYDGGHTPGWADGHCALIEGQRQRPGLE